MLTHTLHVPLPSATQRRVAFTDRILSEQTSAQFFVFIFPVRFPPRLRRVAARGTLFAHVLGEYLPNDNARWTVMAAVRPPEPLVQRRVVEPWKAAGGLHGPHPGGRFGHTAVVAGSEMIVYAGRDTCMYGDVWRYNFELDSWSMDAPITFTRETSVSMGSSSPSRRGSISASEPQSAHHAAAEESSIGGNESRREQDGKLPPARAGHTATLLPEATASSVDGRSRREDQVMIVFGGAVSRTENTNDVWCYHLHEQSWEELHSGKREDGHHPRADGGGGHHHHHQGELVPQCRRGHTANNRGNDNLLIFGGCHDDRVWEFDRTKRSWSVLVTVGNSPPARMYHVAELSEDGRLLIFGGLLVPEDLTTANPNDLALQRHFLSDVVELDLSEARPPVTDDDGASTTTTTTTTSGSSDASTSSPVGHWRTVPAAGDVPSGRMCCTSFFEAGTLCVFGGGSDRLHDECYEFDSHRQRWRRRTSHSCPMLLNRPTVIRRGEQLCIWGGSTGAGFNDNLHILRLEPYSLRDACRLWLRRCGSEELHDAGVPSHLRQLDASPPALPSGASDDIESDMAAGGRP